MWRHTLFLYFNADEDCRPVIIKLMLYLHLIKQHPIKPSLHLQWVGGVISRRFRWLLVLMSIIVPFSPCTCNGGYCRAIDAALSVTNCRSLELIGFNLLCWSQSVSQSFWKKEEKHWSWSCLYLLRRSWTHLYSYLEYATHMSIPLRAHV